MTFYFGASMGFLVGAFVNIVRLFIPYSVPGSVENPAVHIAYTAFILLVSLGFFVLHKLRKLEQQIRDARIASLRTGIRHLEVLQALASEQKPRTTRVAGHRRHRSQAL